VQNLDIDQRRSRPNAKRSNFKGNGEGHRDVT
jgi:hypothetical protein